MKSFTVEYIMTPTNRSRANDHVEKLQAKLKCLDHECAQAIRALNSYANCHGGPTAYAGLEGGSSEFHLAKKRLAKAHAEMAEVERLLAVARSLGTQPRGRVWSKEDLVRRRAEFKNVEPITIANRAG